MTLQGKKIGILIEGDFYEPEIWYYKHRFAEEGVDLHFLTRMWGQTSEVMAAGFKGHEYKIPFEGRVESFEGMDDATLRSFAAIIVPSAMVSDRLRYTEDINKLPPATEFLKRAFAEKSILKGISATGCGWWLPPPKWCSDAGLSSTTTCWAMPAIWVLSMSIRMWWLMATW